MLIAVTSGEHSVGTENTSKAPPLMGRYKTSITCFVRHYVSRKTSLNPALSLSNLLIIAALCNFNAKPETFACAGNVPKSFGTSILI